jgi:hypothetical protein
MAWRIGNVYMNDVCEKKMWKKETKRKLRRYILQFFCVQPEEKKVERRGEKGSPLFFGVCPVDCKSNLCVHERDTLLLKYPLDSSP